MGLGESNGWLLQVHLHAVRFTVLRVTSACDSITRVRQITSSHYKPRDGATRAGLVTWLGTSLVFLQCEVPCTNAAQESVQER